MDVHDKFKPSNPCSCDVCKSYCIRPGWWTVDEAEKALISGLANRMMLEVSPELDTFVLSPAFKGNECNFALQIFSKNGCTFFRNELCELFETGLEPLECRFCHHSRKGKGRLCHLAIEKEWKTERGQSLAIKWGRMMRLW